MGQASIFAGQFIKLLKDQLLFGSTARVLTGIVDPTTNATLAEAGSLYMRVSTTAPGLYIKMDAGTTTNWIKIDPTDEPGVISVLANVANLNGGSIYLPDGRVLMTWDGGGTNPSNFETNLLINLSTLLAPTVGANGYMYIDLVSLAASPTTITGTSYAVYPITASNFVMLTTTPESTDKTRYVPISAFFGEAGPVWGISSWYNFPRRIQPTPLKFVSPVAVTLPPTLIGTVGATGQMMGGHVMDSDSFPIASNLSFWNLISTLSDGSGQGFTLSGSSAFSGIGLVGTDTAANISNALTATNAFFKGSLGGPLMAAGWFKLANWASGSAQALLKSGNTGDLSWEIHVNGDGSLGVQWTDSAVGSYNNTMTVPSPAFVAGSYHHIAFAYANSEIRVYLDGRLTFSYALSASILRPVTGLFTIGGTGISMTVREVCFSTGYVWNDEDIRKLASYKVTHNLGIPSYQQKWLAGRTRADAKITEELGDQGWMIDKSNTKKLYIDFFDFNPLDSVYLRCEDQSTISSLIVAPKTFDSGWLAAVPTFPFIHGLSDIPTAVVLLYELITGSYTLLRVDNYLVWNGTQFTGDAAALGALTINSSHKIRILANIGANISGTPSASLFSSGIVNTADQHFAGNKWLQGNWLPEIDNSFDLGSPSNRWKNIYMTGVLVGGIAEASLTVSGIVNISNQHFAGNKWLQGNWLPETDNLYTLGSSDFRWASLHVGPGSVVVHNDATNTKMLKLDFDSTMARISSDSTSALELMIGASQVGLISTAGVWTLGVSGSTSTHVMNGSLSLVNASAGIASPSVSFGNATTGLYYAGVNQIGFTSNGTQSGLISTAGVWTINNNLLIQNAMPSLTGAQDVNQWLKPLLQLHITNTNAYAKVVQFVCGATTVTSAYRGGVYSPTQNRIYLIPYRQANQTNWHYIDCVTGTVVAYACGVTAVDYGYVGGVYSSTQNKIYLVPYSQSNQTNWHYIDCVTGTVVAYACGVTAVAQGYLGGVYSPTQNRIYLVPFSQANQINWHYIDCVTGTVVAYACGVTAVTGAYQNGAYSPTQNRIYLAPYNQANQTNWHYIDCVTGTVVAYACGVTAVYNGYVGGVYSPAQNKIYLAPSDQASQTNWHYIDCVTGTVVAYTCGVTATITAYAGGVYSPTQNKIYFVPYNQQTNWHALQCFGDSSGINSYQFGSTILSSTL